MAATDLFTLAHLAQQVCENLGAVDDLTQAQAKKWINRALIRFMEMGTWSWQSVNGQTQVTAAGVEEITIANCLNVTSMFMREPIYQKFRLVGDREYRQLWPDNTLQAVPYIYALAGAGATADSKKFRLYPIPDSIYTVYWDGIRKIALLSDDADDVRTVTGMPSNLVDLVIEMATAVGLKGKDDAQSAAQMDECVKRLAAAWAEDQSQIDDVMIMARDGEFDEHSGDPILPPQYSG